MAIRLGASDPKWKRFIGLAVLCGLLVVATGFMRQRAVVAAVEEQQTKAANYVRTQLPDAVAKVDLSKDMSDRDVQALNKAVDAPAGDDVRIYSLESTALFTTEGARAIAGDREAIATAAKGEVSYVVDDGDSLAVYAPIPAKGGHPVGVAAVVSDYAALQADAAGIFGSLRLPLIALAVLFLLVGMALFLRGARASKDPGAVAKPTKSSKAMAEQPKMGKATSGRATGFGDAKPLQTGSTPDPVVAADAPDQVEAVGASADESESVVTTSRFGGRFGKKSGASTKTSGAPKEPKAPKVPKERKPVFARKVETSDVAVGGEESIGAVAFNREVAIREALEDQLEQLRTAMRMQEEQSSHSVRQLTEELEAMTQRVAQAEGQTPQSPGTPPQPQSTETTGPPDRDMIERLQRMESDLAQARAAATEATARADALQQDAHAMPETDAGAADAERQHQIDAMTAELAQAQTSAAAAEARAGEALRAAAESEQRAASIESVRGELEVRVAQLASKAGELEHKATELEARLQEANAGGDAVRAEIATLSTALAEANTRVTQLESTDEDAPSLEEFEANRIEVARLRAELANQMERAQAAEERSATLEADVFAARQGVSELPQEGASVDAGIAETTPAETPPAPSDADRYNGVWSAAFPTPVDLKAASQDDASSPDVESPAPAEASDEPAPADATVSAEDDLWALRERLAHATKPHEGLRERLAHASDEREDRDGSSDTPNWG